jgi:hypothetical protein
MKEKKDLKKRKFELEKSWTASARFYESPESLGALDSGIPLTGVERRRLLGPGRKKLIAVRMPEDDIESLKEIAKRHNRKYQQLVVHAVEIYLDQYQSSVLKRKKAV